MMHIMAMTFYSTKKGSDKSKPFFKLNKTKLIHPGEAILF
jgi:hypothetical protein